MRDRTLMGIIIAAFAGGSLIPIITAYGVSPYLLVALLLTGTVGYIAFSRRRHR